MKLRSHLVLLVVAALVPLLIFAGVMIVLYDRQHRAAVESQTIDTTRALSLAVDREVTAWVSALEALGSSKHLDSGNLSAFREEAARVLKTRKDWDNTLLTDSKGYQLLNLRAPSGSPLPHVRDLEQFQQVVNTSRPVVSNLFLGRVSGKHVIGVAVPVVRDGKVKFVLASSTSPNSLLGILAQQDIPPGWLGTITDRKGFIIARTRDIEKSIGKPAMSLLGTPSGEVAEGLGRGTTDDGTEVQVAFHRSELTGWTVRLAIPVFALEAPLRRSLWIAVGGGLALLLAGIVMAVLFGRPLANSIASLSDAAAALGRSEPSATTISPVNEVNEVAQAIEHAAAQRKRAEERIKQSLEQTRMLQEINQAVSLSLDLQVVLKLLLEKVDLLLPYSAASVMLTNRETGELEPIACRSPDESEWKAHAKMGSGLAKIVLQTRTPLAIRNLATDARVANPDFVRKHGLASFLGLPLIAHDTPLGFIGFNTRAERDFSTEEIEFISAIAAQAAIAIHNSQLYGQISNLAARLVVANERITKTNTELAEANAEVRATIGRLESEVVKRKRLEDFLAGEEQVLEMVAMGLPLSTTLETLVSLIEKQSPEMLCSILLLDRDGATLRIGAAPGLPDTYNRAIDGLTIGPDVGSCGTAAFLRKPVIVSDIASDPLWKNFRALALDHGLRACWSTPILSEDGKVLGTFAMYYREPRSPNAGDIELIHAATHIAGIAIERKALEQAIAGISSQERQRIGQDLHDGLGQELTGIAFLAKGLEEKLQGRSEGESADAKKITRLINEAIGHTRALARGLSPVPVEANGLMSALEELARGVRSVFRISCEFRCEEPVLLADNSAATHLYRIAQEAVDNAVKHGKAKQITIEISANNGTGVLSVADDGRGVRQTADGSRGLGLRIMKHRAEMVQGSVEIQPKDGRGTVVLCSFRLSKIPEVTDNGGVIATRN